MEGFMKRKTLIIGRFSWKTLFNINYNLQECQAFLYNSKVDFFGEIWNKNTVFLSNTMFWFHECLQPPGIMVENPYRVRRKDNNSSFI